jgi:hypothetical protein
MDLKSWMKIKTDIKKQWNDILKISLGLKIKNVLN